MAATDMATSDSEGSRHSLPRAASFDRRQRLLRALARQPVDRIPVICTGGSMTSVPAAVVAQSSYTLPAAHHDAALMAGLALDSARITGFESVGVPLCTTVEAEAYGATIDLGDADTEAHIKQEPFASVLDVVLPSIDDLLQSKRVQVSVEAVRLLAATAGDLPIIANLIGPVSIGASVVEPTAFLRELLSHPQETSALAAHVTDFLIAWSLQLLAAGADCIAIHEDTVTPALAGSRTFERAVFPHLHRLIAAIQQAGGKVLLHMCGALGKSEESLERLGPDAFIPDASIAPVLLKRAVPHVAIIGNISTFVLHQGQPADIAKLARRLIRDGGVDVLSPTCGMSSATPLDNILAMTGAVLLPTTL
jgi:[methyl-Co(III) methanol-specific corrinoid protein]:coenzyme M methyltransferase